MGYNTVVVVLNDALSVGAEDTHLGGRLRTAVLNWSNSARRGNLDFCAIGRSSSSSYGQVISQDHADSYQVTVTHANMGWRVDNAEFDKYLGWHALDQMRGCLERNGYRVAKAKPPKPAPPLPVQQIEG